MVFTKRLRDGIRRGEITCSVRIWLRARVKVGGRYPMDDGQIEVDSIEPIGFPDITPQLARASGFLGVLDLLKVAKHGRGENIYLIRFHYISRQAKSRDKQRTIDEYLTRVTEDKRAALEKLRSIILTAAPGAEECISYQIPAFRFDGKMLVGFGAAANHCAFYPMSSTTVAAHQNELQGYDTSKGTIRFTPQKPLPAALVRKLVKARIAEMKEKGRRV
jgi:uncharacterized protein YdhG (YjbR/CyaY superfamily)